MSKIVTVYFSSDEEDEQADAVNSPGEETRLPPELESTLADVEEEFTRRGGPTMTWDDPHVLPDGELRGSLDEEYSRCLNPGKFRIQWTRALAWAQVLTARGWARRVDDTEWLDAPRHRADELVVLEPRADGAIRVVFALSLVRNGDEELLPVVSVGVGDPAVLIESLPSCGCDACDDGSAGLLEQLDEIVLSIVEGSLEVKQGGEEVSMRTPYGESGGGSTDTERPSAHIVAGPWASTWMPRPLCPGGGDDC